MTLGAVVVASVISLTSMYAEKNYSIIEKSKVAYYQLRGIQQDKNFYSQSLNLKKEVEVGKNGLEFYLENDGFKLPLLKGKEEVQVGSTNYVLNNLPYSDIENYIMSNQNVLSDNAKLKITKLYISQVVRDFSSQVKGYVQNLFEHLTNEYQMNHKTNP